MVNNQLGRPRELIIHPGETLREILEDRNMTQRDLAARTHKTPSFIAKILAGTKNISTSFARELGYALDIDPSIWINLQSQYDLELSAFEERNSISAEEKNIAKQICSAAHAIAEFPINIVDQVLYLRQHISISNLSDIPKVQMHAAFRASKSTTVNPYILAFWLSFCERKLSQVPPLKNPVDIKKLKSLIPQIRSLASEPDINLSVRTLRNIFSDCGIYFFVVKHVTGAPVQGYIKQLPDGHLLLCLTLRGNRADTFWFTLFHEIAHILNGDAKNIFIDFDHSDKSLEDKANTLAGDILIPPDKYRQYLASHMTHTHQSIVNFSDDIAIPPFIVLGRLCKDTYLPYSSYPELTRQYKWKND